MVPVVVIGMELPQSLNRVNQLDAIQVDTEVCLTIQQWIESLLKLYDGRLRYKFQSQIKIVSRIIGVLVPLLETGSTFGMSVLGLRFNRPLYMILGIGQLVCDTLVDKIPVEVRRNFETLNLLNYIAFLYNGSYVTVLHRVLDLKMIPTSSLPTSVDYEYMNRQLVWQALTETSLILVPLLHRYRTLLSRLYFRTRSKSPSLTTGCAQCMHPKPAMRVSCKVCETSYCYYCLASWQFQNNSKKCSKCI